MAKVVLKWTLETRNFDELKLQHSIHTTEYCNLCVLKCDIGCLKRSLCRADSYNEVYINKGVEEIKPWR